MTRQVEGNDELARETDVLVVGAGPTGLTVALLLQRLGVRAVVIDKAAGPSTTSKALGLQYRVSELLSWLGLVDAFLARAATQARVNLYADGARIAQFTLGEMEGRAGKGAFSPRPIILPQCETEELLGAALRDAGGRVFWSHEMVDFSDDGARVVATLADGKSISARWLVSCEGAHSLARKRCGIEFGGKTYPHDFIMADVDIATTLERGVGHSWLHPDGVVSAIGLPGGRWRLFIEAGKVAATLETITLDDVRHLYAERTGDTTSAIMNPTWLTRFKLHSRMVDRFRSGRVFLSGDAAHLHSPSGGQGITTGMQDAYNLAWKLAQVLRHGAPPSLLDSYDAERRPIARAVLATTDRNTSVFFATSSVGKWLRNRVFMPLFGTRPVQRMVFAKLSQLDMGYRASSLSWSRRRRRLRAGDRAPDVLLATDGAQTTLFALLQQTRFVALLTRPNEALASLLSSLGIITRVVAPEGEWRRLYGARAGDAWLIRPDGYIGLVCGDGERVTIASYLEQLWPKETIARLQTQAATLKPVLNY
jgi:4,5-epoxidase